jgi:isocitrate lyase
MAQAVEPLPSSQNALSFNHSPSFNCQKKKKKREKKKIYPKPYIFQKFIPLSC